jgi:Zn-dependent peptidase ImmA (M78 family)/DNA-binding XRE family transcriptional regulator
MTFGIRVREARELRGLTQAQLADRIAGFGLEVDRSAIAHLEAEHNSAKPELRSAIATATDLPASFFEDEDETEFPEGTLLFRARSDMTARQEAQAREWGKLLFRRTLLLSNQLRIPSVTLPRLQGIEADQAAHHARAALGLSPDRPIAHLLNALERAGVVVITVPLRMERRDAYSVWAGDPLRPVIVLMDGATGDRLRFSAAHELGHLVLHTAHPTRVPLIENEASRFASELLMPTGAMVDDLVPPVTLTSLIPLKRKWGVSIQALVRRARAIGAINENQYTYLFQQIGRRGWRMREPEALDIPIEKPRAFRRMVEILYGEPLDYRRLARDLRLFPHEARQILEAFATKADLPKRGSVGAPSVIAFPKPSLIEDD